MLPRRARVKPGSNGNEGVLRISQSPSITGTSPSDRWVSYTGHLLEGESCSQCILQPQPAGQFEIWVIYPNDFTPLLYFSVFVRLGLLGPLTLFFFHNSSFLTAILSYRPTSQSFFQTVDIDTLFSWHGFSCAVIFGAVSLLLRKLMTLIELSSALVDAVGLPALL